MAAYPNKVYAEAMYNNTFLKSRYPSFDYEVIKGDVLSFSIFFDDLKTIYVRQVVKFNATDLFASVGGFLGLLLGASLITLLELLEGIIKVAVIVVRNYFKIYSSLF